MLPVEEICYVRISVCTEEQVVRSTITSHEVKMLTLTIIYV